MYTNLTCQISLLWVLLSYLAHSSSTNVSWRASVATQLTRELPAAISRLVSERHGRRGVQQFVAPSLSQWRPLRAFEGSDLVGVTKRIEQLPRHFVDVSDVCRTEELPPTCEYLAKIEDHDAYIRAVWIFKESSQRL
ncbi:hypothetical protein PF003_g18269 [Phytophthora fragariae]|nr:hypothetical protein PF003_g18269 [Phytophthora fragariae]